jgi:hypothetical protein
MNNFNEAIFKEISYRNDIVSGNLITSEDVEIIGTS